MSLLPTVFMSFGYIPRSGTAGSYGGSIFNFLRPLYTVFCNACTNLQSHWQCARVPFSPHSHKHLLSLGRGFFFFMIDTLIGTRCYLIVVLIFMFLIVSDVEHLFSYQLDIQTSSLEKWLRSSDCFLIGLLGVFLFLLLSCMSSLYILGNNLLIDIKSSRFSR